MSSLLPRGVLTILGLQMFDYMKDPKTPWRQLLKVSTRVPHVPSHIFSSIVSRSQRPPSSLAHSSLMSCACHDQLSRFPNMSPYLSAQYSSPVCRGVGSARRPSLSLVSLLSPRHKDKRLSDESGGPCSPLSEHRAFCVWERSTSAQAPGPPRFLFIVFCTDVRLIGGGGGSSGADGGLLALFIPAGDQAEIRVGGATCGQVEGQEPAQEQPAQAYYGAVHPREETKAPPRQGCRQGCRQGTEGGSRVRIRR